MPQDLHLAGRRRAPPPEGAAPQTVPGQPQTLPRGGRVVMLVTNPCDNDSRVIRSAETVAAMGFETIVLATAAPHLPEVETRNGVSYRRLSLAPSVARQPPPPIPSAAALPEGAPAAAGPSWRATRIGNRVRARLRKPYRLAANAARRGVGAARRVQRTAKGVVKRHFNTTGGTARAGLLFGRPLRELQPDIIHAHDFATLPVAAKAARRSGAICIYDSHELEMHRNVARSRLDRWLCGYLERRYIRATDAVITVCDSIADHLARAYAIPRPEVVMNAPDIAAQRPLDRDLRSDLGLEPGVPLAVYVGRVSIGRGIERLAEALGHLHGVHLALLGTPHAPTVEAALAIAGALNAEARLHVLPPVPPSGLLPYIRTADVSVVPIQNVCLSYYYCLPNKLIESTIAGLPVVVSDFPEMRRYVELGGCGVTMDPEDPADIARAIGEAYRRRDTLRLDPARRELIEARYGWEMQRRKLVDLYRGLVPATASDTAPDRR